MDDQKKFSTLEESNITKSGNNKLLLITVYEQI